MLQKGNPLGITAFADIAKNEVRYVNRQKGSGTRILMDYLCDRYSVDREEVYGYEREEMTHNSVAVQIAGDSADAGMGIYATARLYGLDFLPICVEEYDLLIPDEAYELDIVQKVLEILKSDEFAARIEKLGGYELHHPGTIRRVFDDQAAKEA